jgi:hypothetical protein
MLASERLQAETCLLAPFCDVMSQHSAGPKPAGPSGLRRNHPLRIEADITLDVVTRLLRRPDKGDADHD